MTLAIQGKLVQGKLRSEDVDNKLVFNNFMEVLVITGSTRGIGFCIANYLRSKYKIVIHGKTEESIQSAKKRLGNSDTIYYVTKDLLNQPTELIDMIIDHFGRIDILINNCAIASKIIKIIKMNK